MEVGVAIVAERDAVERDDGERVYRHAITAATTATTTPRTTNRRWEAIWTETAYPW
jgi:hypothetical protein